MFSDRNFDRRSYTLPQSMRRVPFSLPEIDPRAAMCIIKSSGIIKHPVPPRVVTELIPPRLNGLVLGNGTYPGRRSFALATLFRNHRLSSPARSGAFSSGQVNKCEREKGRGSCLHVLGFRDVRPQPKTLLFLPTSPV